MSAYQNDIKAVAALKAAAGSSWSAIDPESVARMRAQNRFKTGLDTIGLWTVDEVVEDLSGHLGFVNNIGLLGLDFFEFHMVFIVSLPTSVSIFQPVF